MCLQLLHSFSFADKLGNSNDVLSSHWLDLRCECAHRPLVAPWICFSVCVFPFCHMWHVARKRTHASMHKQRTRNIALPLVSTILSYHHSYFIQQSTYTNRHAFTFCRSAGIAGRLKLVLFDLVINSIICDLP